MRLGPHLASEFLLAWVKFGLETGGRGLASPGWDDRATRGSVRFRADLAAATKAPARGVPGPPGSPSRARTSGTPRGVHPFRRQAPVGSDFRARREGR